MVKQAQTICRLLLIFVFSKNCNLKNILLFSYCFLNKLYKAIIKRKLQHSMGISKFTAPGPLVNYTFLYRTNTSRVKQRLLAKKVENVKSWYWKNILQKQQQLLTIFAKFSIVHVWQGSIHASVSDFKYTGVLNMSGVRQGSEYARMILNILEYAEIWVTVSKLSEWQMFYFPIVITCLLEHMVTYFNVYTKLEVIVWRNIRLYSWREKN